MTYEETLQYLYNQLPVFQQVGAAAYKPGLGNSLALDQYFGHPHTRFRTIHVGGTNGKGFYLAPVSGYPAKKRL